MRYVFLSYEIKTYYCYYYYYYYYFLFNEGYIFSFFKFFAAVITLVFTRSYF